MSVIAIDASELGISVDDLMSRLKRDQEIILTSSNKPVAKIIAVNEQITSSISEPKRRRGGQSDSIIWISPDFDEPLDDFKEYMP